MNSPKNEYYTKYIGNISVSEFIDPFKDYKRPITSAIFDLVEFWPWNDPNSPTF